MTDLKLAIFIHNKIYKTKTILVSGLQICLTKFILSPKTFPFKIYHYLTSCVYFIIKIVIQKGQNDSKRYHFD